MFPFAEVGERCGGISEDCCAGRYGAKVTGTAVGIFAEVQAGGVKTGVRIAACPKLQPLFP